MPTKITMPQLGESVSEGTVGRWLKHEGDTVKRDEVLVEIVTDKVTAEYPSPVSGRLVKILAKEDETVKVGAEIAEIEEMGASSAAASSPTSTATSAASAASATHAAVRRRRDRAERVLRIDAELAELGLRARELRSDLVAVGLDRARGQRDAEPVVRRAEVVAEELARQALVVRLARRRAEARIAKAGVHRRGGLERAKTLVDAAAVIDDVAAEHAILRAEPR